MPNYTPVKMTTEEKAKAFDLIYSGYVKGMSALWKHYDEFGNCSNDYVLENMARLACEEAIEEVFDPKL